MILLNFYFNELDIFIFPLMPKNLIKIKNFIINLYFIIKLFFHIFT